VLVGDLDALADQHARLDHSHSAAVLSLMRGGRDVSASLAELERRGWARRVGDDGWALTDAGHQEAHARRATAEEGA